MDQQVRPPALASEDGAGRGVEALAQELRVHGVGGSHGAKMLGCLSPTDVVIVGEGVGGAAVLARRHDRGVESYDWGDLTSGSGTRSLWIALLPFTLLNVAGWMHPPAGRTSERRVALIRVVVHALSVLLTATYVFSFGIVLVDLAGWQWTRRYAGGEDTLGWQRVGVVAGLLAVMALAILVMFLAGKSQAKFEGREPAPGVRGDLTGDEPWEPDEGLHCRGFFFHVRAGRRRLRAHRAILILSWAVLAAWSVWQAFLRDTPPERLDVGKVLGPFTLVAVLLLLVLFAVSWDNGRKAGERWVRCGPAIGATLAYALTNAAFSGAILLAVDRLNGWPNRGEGAAPVKAGAEINLVDAWGVMIALLGLLGVGTWFAAQRRPPADLRQRRSAPGRALDGADKAMCTTLAKSRYLARLAHRGGGVALGLAVVLIVADVLVVSFRIVFRNPGSMYLEAVEPTGPLYWLGTYLLLGLVLVLVGMVRKGVGGARTLASTLWDVLTFWPRRFSPLAVRPYSERAVPELQGRIVHHVCDERRPLVVRAHSQGSVLAFAALAPLAPGDTANVAMITYGSPLTTIYATFFPAYFGTDQVADLRAKLASPGPDLAGWRNFYRLTDPIGGPVFPAIDGGSDPGDCELDDPFEGPARTSAGPDPDPPLERDPEPWLRVAGHSYYEREPELKHWTRRLRTALVRR